jgi:glycosyltransferase involved in cell wall biosynthesis
MTKLVSILIPAYNAEKWIADTIHSALGQTWPKKEIIIVDDGSRDDTLNIAKTFQSKIVKVITQKNTGACGARNKALSLAQGSYIQWLDADDLMAPDKISRQLLDDRYCPESKQLMSSSFGLFFYRQDKAIFTPSMLWQNLTPIDWIITKFLHNTWMNPATWLVSRTLTDLAGPWDERLSLDDDGEYFCRLVAGSEQVVFNPDAKCFYRIGNYGSLSKGFSDRACESLFLSLSLCIKYLIALEDSDRTKSASVNLLQTWYPYVYPDKVHLMTKFQSHARQLGGQLDLPVLNWKYACIRSLCGWNAAKYAGRLLPKIKAMSLKYCDYMLYRYSMLKYSPR